MSESIVKLFNKALKNKRTGVIKLIITVCY